MVLLSFVKGTVVFLSVVVDGLKRSVVLEEQMLGERTLVFVQVVDCAWCFVLVCWLGNFSNVVEHVKHDSQLFLPASLIGAARGS